MQAHTVGPRTSCSRDVQLCSSCRSPHTPALCCRVKLCSSHPHAPTQGTVSSPASVMHSRTLPCSPPTTIKGDSFCWGGCVPKWLEEKYVGACLVFSAFSAPNASDALIKHFPHWKRGLCSKARSPSTLQCNALDNLGNHRQAKNAVKVCKHQVKVSVLKPYITTSSSEKQWQGTLQGEHRNLINTKCQHHP